MKQPDGHHLAEFNLGELKYDWEDPRVADFRDNLDRVNGIAKRSPGFVWMLSEDEMEAAQNDAEGFLGGNPRLASTLSVWESVETLEHFVWNTLHKAFYDRKAEWYDPTDKPRLVMWWVPVGHRPDIGEAMSRYRKLEAEGDSPFAFGWAGLKDARLWRHKACGG